MRKKQRLTYAERVKAFERRRAELAKVGVNPELRAAFEAVVAATGR